VQPFVRAARSLVGSRFRPQGRAAESGLDCAGVIILTFGLSPENYRRDYRLRGMNRPEVDEALQRDFRRVARNECRPGDVMMLQVARDQLHLALNTDAGFIHADARLRRVTETPGTPPWPLLAVYRRRSRNLRSL
jgi:hypothetical protein